MYDGRNNAGHGSPDHVGDVWVDDNANGNDSCCRRLLCSGGAVCSTRRGAEEQKKKKALTSAKAISATQKLYAFSIRREQEKCND